MVNSKLSERGKKAAAARWGIHAKTKAGFIELDELKLECYVLEDERRVISFGDFLKAMDMKRGGYKTGDNRAARFASGKLISPFVTAELIHTLRNPTKIITLDNLRAHAYPAETLTELCWSAVIAGRNGVLQPQQKHIAARAEILLKSFSNIGIIGLVDEATGYQYSRDKNSLAEILGELISKEAASWVKRFPDEYYENLFRLYKVEPLRSNKKPWRFGKITKDIVYSRLAPGVVEVLEEVNPINGNGTRKSRHHQHLRESAVSQLNRHIGRVTGIMSVFDDEREFKAELDRQLPVREVENADQES